MAEIAELKKHIINYAKTKGVYTAYRESGYSRDTYDLYVREITIHQAAKKVLNSLKNNDKISLKKLNSELSVCIQKRQTCRQNLFSQKTLVREILAAKANVEKIMNNDPSNKEKMRIRFNR